MHSTNYRETFIAVSPDSTVERAKVPDKAGSVAQLQWRMISADPYRFTSDDVLFAVHAERNGIPPAEHSAAARASFFSRGQPCLRSSPLVKSHGWGIHHDAEGRVAVFAVESPDYAELVERDDVTVVAGMRGKRI
jgi:hypothetical protein